MKHILNIALSTVIILAVILIAFDCFFLHNDTRAMVGIITITGWMSLILFSASHSSELNKV